ncbi:MAG: hypothetical protein NTW38_10965 [Candidatus Aminicenantes bacterium]|nr:hypothetical protein [Candidatus Aminicenantes bacterium]
MSTASLKASLEAERLRLWRQAVKDHPRMTPASAEIVEKEIEKKLKAFAKNVRFPNPIKRPRQISFDFLRDHPVGRRFKNSKLSR